MIRVGLGGFLFCFILFLVQPKTFAGQRLSNIWGKPMRMCTQMERFIFEFCSTLTSEVLNLFAL